MRSINIVSVVDVLGALSRGTLDDHLFMMDSGRDSLEQGSDRLVTVCRPGELLNWVVYAMDVQTPVAIEEIRFLDQGVRFDPLEEPDEKAREVEEPAVGEARDGGYFWSGVVPADLADGLYRYRVTFRMGGGEQGTLSSALAALRIGAASPTHPGERR